ncbi:MAG: caspase family protein [Cyanobacteria bacterium P01_D01_bin.14]
MSRDALIVGINRYQHLPSLKAPSADAEAIAQRLEQDGDFGKIRRLPEHIDQGKPAISSTQTIAQVQLEQALEQLFQPGSAQAPETALFYFSGHGIPDSKGYDQGYLATSDTNPIQSRSGLSLRWLQWLLSESQVQQQIIWLDCCHSGALIVNVGAANPGNSASRDRCFIASSREFESSWEDLNSPYSVLTKALLEGLEPNRLPGRWIDTFALVDYVNQALKGELQTPVCTNFGEAINLTRTWQVPDQTEENTSTDTGICPYKGLEFFDCNGEDPKYFFGREQLVSQLLDHVRTNNFLALVGASGNGKSSVLRAGLLHQLKLGRRIAGSDQWQILITRPDAQPMKNLAAAFVSDTGTQLDRAEALGRAERLLKDGAVGLVRLVQASTATRTILVIDQFEEVFTRCESDGERAQFFACLMGALAETGDKLCLVIAMRADFVGKCLAQDYSGLAQRVQQQMVSVLPLTGDELKDAIGKPAEQVGLVVEPALTTEILNDIKGAPGNLPLLQYTLKELWQRRAGNKLLLSAYQDLGGISGTLDKRATEIYNSFDTAQQRTVQHIFQQLTQLGEGTEDTRRRVFFDNLIAEPLHPVGHVREVVETLSDRDNRLLVTSEVVGKGEAAIRRAIVDVAHEALIRHWLLLRKWIEKNRDLLRQQRRIEASSAAWQEREKAKGYLLQGLLLAEAIQFQKKQAATFPLSDSARSFVQRSKRQQYWNRCKTAIWLVVPAALVVGVVEHSIRESDVKADYARLDSESKYEERQGVEDLVAGCRFQRMNPLIPSYLSERISGNCRFLWDAPLADANLSFALLSFARLGFADISNADLTNTFLGFATLSSADLRSSRLHYAQLEFSNLFFTDLSNADLNNASLFNAFLRGADLTDTNFSDTNLSGTIFLATDLRDAKELTQAQFEGEVPPYICNSPLPGDIEIDGGKDRDCDSLAVILLERWHPRLNSLKEAEEYVDEQRYKSWE